MPLKEVGDLVIGDKIDEFCSIVNNYLYDLRRMDLVN